MCYCYGLLAAVAIVGEAARIIATTTLWRFHSAPINTSLEHMFFRGVREKRTCGVLSVLKSQARTWWRAVRRLVSAFDQCYTTKACSPTLGWPPSLRQTNAANFCSEAPGLMVSQPCYLRLISPNFTYSAYLAIHCQQDAGHSMCAFLF